MVLHLLRHMLSDISAINLIVNCTARKTVKCSAIAARSMNGARLEMRIEQWTQALEKCSAPTVRASDLYCGDSWATIRSAISASRFDHDVHWWIVSAGYGLIRSDELLVPYSATFTRGHEDSVVQPGDFAAAQQQWWDGLCAWKRSLRRRPSSLQRLASMFPARPLLIALSAEYVSALENDLLAAREELTDPDLLVIVSAGGRKDGPLAASFLPCDARLENVLGGVRASLNARIVRRILETVPPENVRISHLRVAFGNLLRRQPPPRLIERERLDDGKVVEFIERALVESVRPSHTALLRALRESGLACEQKRFRKLFHETKNSFFPLA